MSDSSQPAGTKDFLDRALTAVSALSPIVVIVVGYLLNTSLEHTRAEVNATKLKLEENTQQLANLKLAEETSSLALQQRVDKVKVINDFLKELTGEDDRRRSLAIEVIFIALPDEAPRLVRVVERFGASGKIEQKDAATAQDALASTRNRLIEDMFSEVRTTRVQALATLQKGWSDDGLLIDQLIARATADAEARKARPDANDDVARQQIASLFNTVKFLGGIKVPSDAATKARIKSFLTLVQSSSTDTRREAQAILRRYE